MGISADEYRLRTAAWKLMLAGAETLQDSDEPTETVLANFRERLDAIRRELADDRRTAAFAGKIAKVT